MTRRDTDSGERGDDITRVPEEEPSTERPRARWRWLVRPLIVAVVTTVAGVVLTTVGGRLWWWAGAPIWLLAISGATTGNVVGQLALTGYYVDTAMDRLEGEKEWWLLAPGQGSALLFVAGSLVFDAQTRAIGGPAGWPVVIVQFGVISVMAVVIYWLPKLRRRPDSDAR